MRGQPQHKALVGAVRPIRPSVVLPRWPEEQLQALEYMAKFFGHIQVDFRLRSFDERPAIHIEWRTNCTKCGATQAGHYLHRFSCEEPVFETKLVYHYQPDEERQAILMSRFDILETLKDWNAEWAER